MSDGTTPTCGLCDAKQREIERLRAENDRLEDLVKKREFSATILRERDEARAEVERLGAVRLGLALQINGERFCTMHGYRSGAVCPQCAAAQPEEPRPLVCEHCGQELRMPVAPGVWKCLRCGTVAGAAQPEDKSRG